jgi:hypothetical protein
MKRVLSRLLRAVNGHSQHSRRLRRLSPHKLTWEWRDIARLMSYLRGKHSIQAYHITHKLLQLKGFVASVSSVSRHPE